MIQTNNVNIVNQIPLPSPNEVRAELCANEADQQRVFDDRKMIAQILEHNVKKHIMIVGPCSIHNLDEAMAYAHKLKALSEEVNDKIMLVMRVYFEKPRTILGWKGLIYDPELNGSYNIKKGLLLARKLLLDIVEIGLPTATEILDPVITQYIADLVSWSAIGARTTESQTHRQLVSGLSMPTGFKNTTDGSIKVAIEAIKASMAKHSFLGVLDDGRSGIFRTKGNQNAHLVLRGGAQGPNYGSEYIAFARELMKKAGLIPNIVVDCSHANSNKQPLKQVDVLNDLVQQIVDGEEAIVGSMIESNLKTGSQKVDDVNNIKPGLSITDACLGWEETEACIKDIYTKL